MEELRKSRLVFSIGKANIADNFEEALKRCSVILNEKFQPHGNLDN
jgi:hypothetical protein